ncbi:MAG TPA: response regulator [Ruminiclostridium sp.]
MFNVLIVDDNQIVLDGLVKFVNWAELGYKVIGVALSPDEAIKIIETEYVDVILSDVVMPGKTGFDLIKEAQQINPIIKTVILSSFGEFKYAQEAMRLGAYDYLVKPVDFGELKRVFNEIKSKLEKEILEKQEQGDYRAITQVQFINNLVNGFYCDIEEIMEKAYNIGFELLDGDFCVVRLLLEEDVEGNISVREKNYSEIHKGIAEEMKGYLINFGEVYTFNSNLFETGALFYPNSVHELRNILDKFPERFKVSEFEKVYLGIGNNYSNSSDISKSFSEAGKALEYRHVDKESNIFYFSELSEGINDEIVVSNSKYKARGMAIENVITYINEHYNEDITLQRLSEIAYVHPTYLSKLFKEKSGENFMDFLMKVRVERAKVLLKDLSYHIYDVCQMVGYESPKHFSKVFKEITGITPKEFRNGS